MSGFQGSASARVAADPGSIFDVITDLQRLPEWNDAIERVVEAPSALTDGAEWVVTMHPARGMKWNSRTRLVKLDPVHYQFSYRSGTDDDNPSYALWHWDVSPASTGSEVTVSWEAHPETVGRRLLAAPLRRRMLEREVAKSLDALSNTVAKS